MDPGCVVRNGKDLIIFTSHQRAVNRSRLMLNCLGGILLHILNHSERRVQASRLIVKKLYSKIHFYDGKAHVNAFLNGFSHIGTGVLAIHVGITVNSYLITEFSAKHLPKRNAPRLSCQVPQSDLNSRNTASLSGGAAKLLDSAKEFVHVARIFTHKARFQHQSVGGTGSIPHLTISNQPLIGVYLDQRAVLGCSVDIRNTNVRYF